jgi:DnaK suppressor protein
MSEPALTPEQLEELRAILVATKDENDRHLAASAEDARPVDLDLSIGRLSRMDALQQQHMAMARVRRVEEQQDQIRAALRRIEDGTFGECLRCGEPIAFARLRVRPEATLCKECQAER